MTSTNYWGRQHLGRRRFLRAGAVGLGGIAAASLVGCSSDEAPPGTPGVQAPTAGPGGATPAATEAPSFLTPIVDSSAQAVPGGVLPFFATSDPPELDPITAQTAQTAAYTNYVYPQLLEFAPGLLGATPSGDVQAAAAETFEFAEPTKLILRLRTDIKWDSRTPTSSRPLVADDVVFSWNKFEAQSVNRGSLAHSASEQAPVTSVHAIDDHTVEVNTAFPYGPLLAGLAYPRWVPIMPMESDGGFDPRQDMRGAGPWTLTRYDRSVRMEFRKNPDYWGHQPYMDGIDRPIIGEYAQRLAQFRAGRIYGAVVSQEDVIATKRDIPELDVYHGDFGDTIHDINFGLRPGSPFRDERVRQAVSMSIDRDLLIDTFYNVDEFRREGWPVSTRWPNIGIATLFDSMWVDPQSDEMGAGRQAFEYDPAEAKRLLSAAGHNDPIETTLSYSSTVYGAVYIRVAESYIGLLNETGNFRLEPRPLEYATEFIPNLFFAQQDFDGLAWTVSAFRGHPVVSAFQQTHSQGPRQHVAFQGDPSSVEGTADSDAMIEAAMRSLDFDEQVDIIRGWQVKHGPRMPLVPSPVTTGGARPYLLQWPWAKNTRTFREYAENPGTTSLPHWWLDQPAMPR